LGTLVKNREFCLLVRGELRADDMRVDTSSVFKRPLRCLRCDEAFYFTLRAIAESQKLACPHCATGMDLNDDAYRLVVADVRATIKEISEPR
jgi:hypothetical protein